MSEQTAGKAPVMAWGAGSATRDGMLRRRYPTIGDLRKRAKWRVPSFGFDYVETTIAGTPIIYRCG